MPQARTAHQPRRASKAVKTAPQPSAMEPACEVGQTMKAPAAQPRLRAARRRRPPVPMFRCMISSENGSELLREMILNEKKIKQSKHLRLQPPLRLEDSLTESTFPIKMGTGTEFLNSKRSCLTTGMQPAEREKRVNLDSSCKNPLPSGF